MLHKQMNELNELNELNEQLRLTAYPLLSLGNRIPHKYIYGEPLKTAVLSGSL